MKMLVTGVEPVTLGLLDPRSNRLSYTSLYHRRFTVVEDIGLHNAIFIGTMHASIAQLGER